MKIYRYTRGAPLPIELEEDFKESEKGLSEINGIPVRYGDYVILSEDQQIQVMNSTQYRKMVKQDE